MNILGLLTLEWLAHRNPCIISKQVYKCSGSLRFLPYLDNSVGSRLAAFKELKDIAIAATEAATCRLDTLSSR